MKIKSSVEIYSEMKEDTLYNAHKRFDDEWVLLSDIDKWLSKQSIYVIKSFANELKRKAKEGD